LVTGRYPYDGGNLGIGKGPGAVEILGVEPSVPEGLPVVFVLAIQVQS
jgi:hypothetical protein